MRMAPAARYDSESVDTTPLGQALQFGFSGRTAPNRFLKAAMTEKLASWDPLHLGARGVPSRNLINLYKRWAEGGIGVIVTGNILIEYDHIEAPGNAIIARDSVFSGPRFDAFKEMATEAKKHGSLFIGQLNHPGRQVQSLIQKDPISASDVQLEGEIMGATFEKPRAATTEDIANIIEGFAHAAEYLQKAGFDGIELNAAHGYLLAQFLSPTTNRRTDKYGGSIDNRTRLIVDITEAIRARVSQGFVIGIKLNSVEFQDKGLSTEEAKKICKILEENNIDFVELSGGTFEQLAFEHKRESTKRREGFFLEFAELIAPALSKTRTYITGGFKTTGAMVKALNAADGVGLARPLTQEPSLCKDMLEGKVEGAIKQAIDDNDFMITSVASGAQMLQMSKGEEPVDLSHQEAVNAFMHDVGDWFKQMAQDTTMQTYGNLEVSSSYIH